MSSFEFNKILAALIVALISIFSISKIGDFLIGNKNSEQLEIAYKIDIPETSGVTTTSLKSLEQVEPISALLSTASLEYN